MNYENMTRKELIEALEAVGAGGVSAQRITQPCPSDETQWKQVPVRLTDEMLAAAQRAWAADPLKRTSTMWAAMLAAAPAAPTPPQTTYTPVGVVVPDEDIGMPNVFAARMLSGVIVEGETLYRATPVTGVKS